jgi:hypothetical protein
MTLVSQAEFARMCDVSRKTVTTWAALGKLVMQGKRVDVEETEARMSRLHRVGSPIKNAPEKIVTLAGEGVTKRARGSDFVAPKGNKTAETELLSVGEIEARLCALDWEQTFDWTPAAVDQRVRRAARCIGWDAVTSASRDDGHWGGYQLRIAQFSADELSCDVIQAGHGFNLDAFDVLEMVRDHISARLDADGAIIQDDDDVIPVDHDSLHLLALPFGELQIRP